jgi:hypothetical protein
MPYSKSRARTEFESKSIELVALARQISYKNVPLKYDHKNLIFQSTIVLLCSALEEYLRVFIEDLFFRYKSKNATISDTPVNSRTYTLFNNQRVIYESFINNRDEAKILEKLDVRNTYLYSLIDDTKKFTNQINAKSIVNDKKYPSPKNLKILFNRIGIKNIFGETEKLGKKNYELILRSFLDIRETIAHQESTDLTFDDVKRNFKNIMDLLDKIDRVSYRHICILSGQNFWK